MFGWSTFRCHIDCDAHKFILKSIQIAFRNTIRQSNIREMPESLNSFGSILKTWYKQNNNHAERQKLINFSNAISLTYLLNTFFIYLTRFYSNSTTSVFNALLITLSYCVMEYFALMIQVAVNFYIFQVMCSIWSQAFHVIVNLSTKLIENQLIF